MKDKSLFINTGAFSIRLNFLSHSFADRAADHIFLYEQESTPVIGTIDYLEDDSISTGASASGKPNTVHIEKNDLGDGSSRVSLNMFDKYLILLDIGKKTVRVRYPPDAPVNLMMDDVLQAALSPLLSTVGGFILHGSCVVRDHVAIAIMGASGSGKSTTAFNLTRFGFQCYADDAVVVVPCGGRLYAHPLAKEISVRPLAFSLLQAQGVWADNYRKDGDKYYFKLKNGKPHSAILQHICFVQVCGESETTITFLNHEQTLNILLTEKRHFSFLERHKAEIYAQVLAKMVPAPFCACVGTDLDYQGRIFESMVTGRLPSGTQTKTLSENHHGRRQKKDLIRKAWGSPEHAPLAELIPLLGDFDLQVLKLAFSFFQTYPVAQIEPVREPIVDVKIPGNIETDWLPAFDWLKGCEQLAKQYSAEVFEKFAYPWIRSAPLIYPFLKVATAGHPAKFSLVNSAWSKFVREKTTDIMDRCDSQKKVIWFDASGTMLSCAAANGLHADITEDTQVCCLFFEESQMIPTEMNRVFKTLRQAASITVIPLYRQAGGAIKAALAFIRQALEYGLQVKISRHIPLCSLSAADAYFLLNAGAFQLSGGNRAPFSVYSERSGDHIGPACPDLIVERPESSCSTCCLYSLGLCSEGF